jgi:hypothetical protein
VFCCRRKSNAVPCDNIVRPSTRHCKMWSTYARDKCGLSRACSRTPCTILSRFSSQFISLLRFALLCYDRYLVLALLDFRTFEESILRVLGALECPSTRLFAGFQILSNHEYISHQYDVAAHCSGGNLRCYFAILHTASSRSSALPNFSFPLRVVICL